MTDTSEYYSELYTYEEGGYHEESVTGVFRGPSATTIKPDRETTFVSEVEFRGLSITDKYEYDLHGNISKKVTGGKEIRYTYDDIDRLVREDNAALNKTYFYEYDDFGNIEKITTYNYTTGNSLTGGVTKTYAYDSSERLISVTENGVTQNIGGYDALGNPSNYKGNTLTWTRGRILAGYGNNSYLYDMDGVRQEKTVNGVVHTYYTDGTKIIAEKVGEKVFEYYYDAQGIIAFKYDGAVYYFKKNLMGDIDRIYDANKNLVAEYKYDAWGNHRVYTGTGIDITDNSSYNNSVAKLNPFRYRGYYYDEETSLYYLNSRYYDPEVGRFLSADTVEYLNPGAINGINLYAYCMNNPIMYTDPYGTTAWWEWVGLVVLSIVAVGAIVAGTILSGGATAIGFAGLAGSVLSGAGVGFLGGASANLMLQGAATGWDFSAIDPVSVMRAGGIGAAIGGVGGFTSYGIGQVGHLIGIHAGNYISSMTIAGLNVGKVFEYLGGVNMITSLFSNIGKISGAILGSYVANDGMNRLFANTTTSRQNILDAFSGEMQSTIFGLIYKFIRWAI